MSKIINERLDAEQYLLGNNLNHHSEYRIVLLLAKWYYSQGCTTPAQILSNIKKWAMKNNFFINVSIKNIARRVIDNDMKFCGDMSIYINQTDIDAVNYFDTEADKLTAFAIICYAKAYADDKGEFKISYSAMGQWLGLESSRSIPNRVRTLMDYGLIEQVDDSDTKLWYSTVVYNSLNKYRVLIDLVNDGDYCMTDNDIQKFFDKVINGIDRESEIWVNIDNYNHWYQISNYMRVRALEREINGKKFGQKILSSRNYNGDKYVMLKGDDGKQHSVGIHKLYSKMFG